MKIYICFMLMMLMSVGCVHTDIQRQKITKGRIVQSCYTVLRYSPEDKEDRINFYLQVRQMEGQINEIQKYIIKKSLESTQQLLKHKGIQELR